MLKHYKKKLIMKRKKVNRDIATQILSRLPSDDLDPKRLMWLDLK